MNIYRIAGKLYAQTRKERTSLVIQVSKISVALGVCVLILTFAITAGFRHEVQTKITGLGAHIAVSHYDNNESFQKVPIVDSKNLRRRILAQDNVSHLQATAHIAGIIQGNKDVEGVAFKGVGADYDTSFLSRQIVQGRCLHLEDSVVSNELLVSETFSKRTGLQLGDKVNAFFVQNPVRQRKFVITGIYNTGLGMYDKTYVMCDIRQVIKLKGWADDRVDALEVFVNDFSLLDVTTDKVNMAIDYDMKAESIKEQQKEVFNWIDLVEQNVVVLIVLIIVIVAVSLISTQLTFALEHIPTIGILKTMGCRNVAISRIFMWVSFRVLVGGLLWGNAVGLLLCWLQHTFHIVTLNPENYYMSYVPIDVQWLHVLLINIGIMLISWCVLVLPAYFVAKKVRITDAVAMK